MTDPRLQELACPGRERGIFTNRTLNLRSIRAIGYDMDYTLIHYNTDAWERQAYEFMKGKLAAQGLPVADLEYLADFITRGLVIDVERGNIVKANRFGYVKQASHGTRMLSFEEQRSLYSRTLIEFGRPRYVFLNTLFSLSEACMFAQLVDRLDEGRIGSAIGYEELHRVVHRALDESHAEGVLKSEILANPDAYIEHDPGTTRALLDQKLAGRKLVLITNSDWEYTRRVMAHEFDRQLPEGESWLELFDLVMVSSRKPSFFNNPNPAFEVVRRDEGLLKPVIGGLSEGKVYVGGNARLVEELWDLGGEQILYVGDHIYSDVEVSKNLLRWRTALVLRELEGEVESLTEFSERQRELARLMKRKEELELAHNRVRLIVQRIQARDGGGGELKKYQRRNSQLWEKISELDRKIGPLAQSAGELLNRHWGLVMRAGNDKSLLARQVENFADIYMSRVSNFIYATPFGYLRSQRSTLPHDHEDASLSETGESN
ncbi:MAG: hypothetical protein MAG453_01657 [Calditrichaeota bacterium]|nr:hypothetical protein [Calditrichota bacterium]